MSGLTGSVLGGSARGGAEARLVAQKKCYGRKGKGPVAYKQAKGIGGGKRQLCWNIFTLKFLGVVVFFF